MLDINEATDVFESLIVNAVNEAQIPMVNIELVLNKVLSAVREAKLRTIREARIRDAEVNNTEEITEGVIDEESGED